MDSVVVVVVVVVVLLVLVLTSGLTVMSSVSIHKGNPVNIKHKLVNVCTRIFLLDI